ncbi:VOC family protein [Williamsia phyllosphaerae]|uniref:Glyoxalase/bleomycin resistance protein/dioxygenase n=1 Tax=Williamsia phyllosphaerae TaxID=885042 RepID=A0ABQ1V1R6_9NOCA|nr:VOC family protein [Williamsia phyllosphaerae]GGF33395.1 glyoxalase/bleomycin resistance protein/dioxygenase [Williamsia phyllosphaerae]
MFEHAAIRIARPCTNLEIAERFYVRGLGFAVLARVAGEGRDEHDLVMVGAPGAAWHIELVGGPNLSVTPTPTAEDLLILYLDAPVDPAVIARIEEAGGRVVSQGKYWDEWGVTVEDPDGYRLVLSTRGWD